MEMNGAILQVNAYVFSTEDVPSVTTFAYSSATNYANIVSWTYQV